MIDNVLTYFEKAMKLGNDDSIYHNGTNLEIDTSTAIELSISGTPEADLAADGFNIITGDSYQINDTSVLNATTLGSAVVNSSLTGFGVMASPVLTTPQINDTSADHQYIFAVSELSADRTVTLPLLAGNDEFVFKDFIQTLTNKTLTSPTLTSPALGTPASMPLRFSAS